MNWKIPLFTEIKDTGSVEFKTERVLFGYPKIHRPENTDAFEKLKSIVDAFFVIEKIVFPCHPRTENLRIIETIWFVGYANKENKSYKASWIFGYANVGKECKENSDRFGWHSKGGIHF